MKDNTIIDTKNRKHTYFYTELQKTHSYMYNFARQQQNVKINEQTKLF